MFLRFLSDALPVGSCKMVAAAGREAGMRSLPSLSPRHHAISPSLRMGHLLSTVGESKFADLLGDSSRNRARLRNEHVQRADALQQLGQHVADIQVKCERRVGNLNFNLSVDTLARQDLYFKSPQTSQTIPFCIRILSCRASQSFRIL